MATKYIDPDMGSGYDYDSLADWEADRQGDLTSRAEIETATCRCTGGTADTSAVTISGWTTSSTHYIKIWTDPSESYRHDGKWNTSKYRMVVTLDSNFEHCITISDDDYIKIYGIQFNLNWSGSGPGYWFNDCVYINYVAANVVIESCIFRQSGTPTANDGYSYGVCFAGGTSYLINCVFYDFRGGTVDLYWSCGVITTGSSTVYAYNCTAHDCDYGFYEYEGTLICINCIADGCSDGFSSGVSTSYCATSGSEGLSGTGDRNSQTFSFTDASNGDFHLTASDTGARGYGTNLYNDSVYAFQTDIDGQDRGGSGATWDIGADEYLNSSLPPHLLTPQRSIQHLLVR